MSSPSFFLSVITSSMFHACVSSSTVSSLWCIRISYTPATISPSTWKAMPSSVIDVIHRRKRVQWNLLTTGSKQCLFTHFVALPVLWNLFLRFQVIFIFCFKNCNSVTAFAKHFNFETFNYSIKVAWKCKTWHCVTWRRRTKLRDTLSVDAMSRKCCNRITVFKQKIKMTWKRKNRFHNTGRATKCVNRHCLEPVVSRFHGIRLRRCMTSMTDDGIAFKYSD